MDYCLTELQYQLKTVNASLTDMEICLCTAPLLRFVKISTVDMIKQPDFFNELEIHELIIKKQQGKGKPNRIYIKPFYKNSEFQ